MMRRLPAIDPLGRCHSVTRLSWAKYKGQVKVKELCVLANAGAGLGMAELERQVGAVLLTM